MKRTALKRKQPHRDWSDARLKVEREGVCRLSDPLHPCYAHLEAAHTIGRAHDEPRTFVPYGERAILYVNPHSIVPLCSTHHSAYDGHTIDLLGHLTVDEELDAVKRAGGLELARVRLCPTAYRQAA